MKFNYKSRKGFTLIELLVVIGILAVLAAIAIPSVAGLIDRANVSADKTNSNEMTNAVERFASEYELYCQDIASGYIKDTDNDGTPDNMDSAQGRVFNVTGVKTRDDITALESTGLNGKQINRDTKYPVNTDTLEAVVVNYTKTSSSTFEPKQSDMHYWYSPDCGVVVFAEPDADQDKENKLNAQIQSGKDAKGKDLGPDTQWINITAKASETSVSVNGAILFDGTNLTWEDMLLVANGEKYGYDASALTSDSIGLRAFADCTALKEFNIPNNITSVGIGAFDGCTSLTSVTVPGSITNLSTGMFSRCISLKNIELSNGITSIGSSAFQGCTGLENITLPNTLSNIEANAFYGCSSLKSITIPNSMTSLKQEIFSGCTSLTNVTIPSSVTSIGSSTFMNCDNLNNISYGGTMAQWNSVSKPSFWNYNCPQFTVTCTDGTITVPAWS